MTEPTRWGFAGLSDEEFQEFAGGAPRSSAPECPSSTEEVDTTGAEQPVTVGIDRYGAPSVSLSPDWRSSVDPRDLGSVVLSEHRAALLHSLGDMSPAPACASVGAVRPVDLGPWAGDVRRMADEALNDVRRLAEAVRAHRTSTTEVVSAGGRVRGRTYGAAITDVVVDAHWARGAPRGEVERELTDALGRLRAAAAPPRLTRGPTSEAARTVVALAADPHALVYAAGLRP